MKTLPLSQKDKEENTTFNNGNRKLDMHILIYKIK